MDIDTPSRTRPSRSGPPDLAAIAPTDVPDAYDRLGLDRLTDAQLVAAVSAVLARPKVDPADSFVLHAPLELLARAALLRMVPPHDRRAARRRLVWLAASFAAAGQSLPDPEPGPGVNPSGAAGRDRDPIDSIARRLIAALERGELDDVDRLTVALARSSTPIELQRHLSGAVVTSLAAAAHASILLYLLPRAHDAVDLGIARGPLRELARHPDWKIRWFEDPDEPPAPMRLRMALLDVPTLGVPGSTFIFPIMAQAAESGLAVARLSDAISHRVDRVTARQELSRVAAWSMLQESAEHAPYGWTHCLTMPQAVISLAGRTSDPRVALAVAATHVVGFRAALGHAHLDPDHQPDRPRVDGGEDLAELLASGRDEAAAAAWHTPSDRLGDLVAALAANAAVHHDAHLAKYTLACFDAGVADPSHRRLYLAAAASLAAWWASQPGDELATTT
jgi:hypothetical protein